MAQVTLTIKVNLDSTGYGEFSTPELAAVAVQQILNTQIGHYRPEVYLNGFIARFFTTKEIQELDQ